MPYLPTAQDWLTQSALLLKARPTSTRIATKYTINPTPQKKTKPPPNADPTATRATLTLTTYDDHSGVTLKYETKKAQEVSRLIASLGRLGRGMARLPELSEADDVVMGDDADAAGAEAGVSTPKIESGIATPLGEGKPLGDGGKKKKKKGKK